MVTNTLNYLRTTLHGGPQRNAFYVKLFCAGEFNFKVALAWLHSVLFDREESPIGAQLLYFE